MKNYWKLFVVFAQIGVCTFGGGYAMLSLLQKVIVEKYHWATEEELMDYYAIGQCTPGIIAINTATFIGYKVLGISGAIIATLGFVFPSIIIITLIAAFMQNFASLSIVEHAFAGIRVCVCVLIFDAVLKLGKKSIVNRISVVIFLVVAALSIFTPISTVALVLASGFAGYIIYIVGAAKKTGGKQA